MKERPILFSAPMVRAILDGKKTQTRRVIKPQPRDRGVEEMICENEDGGFFLDHPGNETLEIFKCPYGTAGDRLWVRETWGEIDDGMQSPICYSADMSAQWRSDPKLETERRTEGLDAHFVMPKKWRPSIHMPRWASRITLEITGVRVERVQGIISQDARAEGFTAGDRASETDAFHNTWEEIYGPESWAANPWVWVVEFKRIDATIARKEQRKSRMTKIAEKKRATSTKQS